MENENLPAAPATPAAPAAPAVPSPAPAEPAAAPKAAATVAAGKTEKEIALENQLKEAQLKCATAEDEAKRLKDLQTGATPAKKKKKKYGFTLLHPVEEVDDDEAED